MESHRFSHTESRGFSPDFSGFQVGKDETVNLIQLKTLRKGDTMLGYCIPLIPRCPKMTIILLVY